MTTFYIIAGLITLALASYATFLLYKLNKQKEAIEQSEAAQVEKHDAQIKSIIESIISIAKAMQHEQCPTIEGCIRLKVLIDQLRLDEQLRDNFTVFYTIYDKTAHIPTHEGWKDLKTKEKMMHTKLMMEIESEYESEIKQSVDKAVLHFQSSEQSIS
ncbi:DUF2489 domain-containing protein [Kangiella koreensis]|uniref:DUF2489 domain-containing protein n=1 Tax=Kangiella koreensis (strain DSM 16069 / JCM 12317 / KCTC 12182 / SW-125) TaxID=523791 RepID=C7RC77_KANKD|nr:DUF2489 domain-containing protein [Kangiella koreensis]ACV26869.1 conserved hypothetical protein [Kangiella koreensis DSM 16069]